ncbi:MAG: WbqC family protein [Elusimicrobia bacterium]|nr:WbqC family protein [Elusimicrobiota bacterium]
MFVTIHQPEFMPWAGFFNKIVQTDLFIVFDSAKFKKNYFDNRCRIKQGGAAKWLTVPVVGRDSTQAFLDVAVAEGDWSRKAWSTLQLNYRGAPHWAEHEPFLKDFFAPGRWRRLIDMNLAFIEYGCASLSIPLKLRRASEMGVSSAGSRLVLDLCLAAGADSYLSGAFGRDYLDEDSFAEAGVALKYQDYTQPPYEQFDGPYVGPLSLIDMLLNVGSRGRELLGAK